MSWLAGKVAGPLFAGLSVVALLGAAWLGIQLHFANKTIKTLNARVESLATDLGTCRANTTTLESAITRQNDAIEAAAAERDATLARLEGAVDSARANAANAAARAQAILNGTGEGDACQNADDVIMGAVE